MSTVSIRAGISTLRTCTVRCPGCHAEHAIPADRIDFWPLCPACRKSAAWAEARKLINAVLDLRRGTGVFSDLTLDERLEQLQALGIGEQPEFPRLAAGSILEIVQQLPSDNLIDLGAHVGDEISRRLGSAEIAPADRLNDPDYAPTAALRIEIENALEDQARQEVLVREAAGDPERWDGMA